MHLLTRQPRPPHKLANDGVLAIHVTNRYWTWRPSWAAGPRAQPRRTLPVLVEHRRRLRALRHGLIVLAREGHLRPQGAQVQALVPTTPPGRRLLPWPPSAGVALASGRPRDREGLQKDVTIAPRLVVQCAHLWTAEWAPRRRLVLPHIKTGPARPAAALQAERHPAVDALTRSMQGSRLGPARRAPEWSSTARPSPPRRLPRPRASRRARVQARRREASLWVARHRSPVLVQRTRASMTGPAACVEIRLRVSPGPTSPRHPARRDRPISPGAGAGAPLPWTTRPRAGGPGAVTITRRRRCRAGASATADPPPAFPAEFAIESVRLVFRRDAWRDPPVSWQRLRDVPRTSHPRPGDGALQ
jgi:hypothetical protein